MALQKNITLTNNFGEDSTFTNAYIKVSEVVGKKEELSAVVSIYKEKDGFLLTSTRHSFTPSVADDSANFIKQAYDYIKSLDEYSTAVDV